MALRHLALKTRDLETTRRFYVVVPSVGGLDHFGLRVTCNRSGTLRKRLKDAVELYAD